MRALRRCTLFAPPPKFVSLRLAKVSSPTLGRCFRAEVADRSGLVASLSSGLAEAEPSKGFMTVVTCSLIWRSWSPTRGDCFRTWRFCVAYIFVPFNGSRMR